MKRFSKHACVLSPVLLMIGVCLSIYPVSLSLSQLLSDGIAAIVNTKVITISELKMELRDETIRLKAHYEGKELEQRLTHKEYTVLNQIIERTLQLEEATAKGITVSEEELDQAMGQFRHNQSTNAIPQSRIREELTLRKVLDFEIRHRLIISPEEIHHYYTKNKNAFTTPAQYHLRQILLKPQSGETIADVLAQAKSLVQQLSDGADFSELAEYYSEGPESIHGGDLGVLSKDELVGPLRHALDSMKSGEVSHPVETDLGIHIIRLENLTLGRSLPFDKVKDAIKKSLLQRKTHEARQEWLSALKDKAYIDIRL